MPQGRSVSFTVPGRLGGKGRHRTAHRGGFAVAYTPKETRMQEAIVADIAALAKRDQGCPQLTGPVVLTISISRHTPASWTQKKAKAAYWVTGKPDASNVLKLIEDGINHSGIWFDDAQVAQLHLIRVYDNSVEEATTVIIEALGEP